MTYLHYKLTLRAPALLTVLKEEPNSAATGIYISGSSVRGAVAARLAQQNATVSDFENLILSGVVRYLNAYPEVSGARSMPVPASWRALKYTSETVYDLSEFSGSVDEANFEIEWPGEALVSPAARFAATSSRAGKRALVGAALQGRLHQQRDRLKGRPWKDDQGQSHGAIYAYEYLDQEQTFRGVIQIQAGADHNRLKRSFSGSVLLGRSRRGGYGGNAAVEFTHDSEAEYEDVGGLQSGDLQAGTLFRAILTSPYIGRDPVSGQNDPAALQGELCKALGWACSVERRRWTFELTGGFNRKWRLELPQCWAAAGGSVLVLKAAQTISASTLREVEHSGLGERRIEGFGRLLFLQHADGRNQITTCIPERKKPQVQQSPINDTDISFLESRIVLAAAKAELERVATLDIAARCSNIPTPALLGRLRTPLRGAGSESALASLATWCGTSDASLKEPARKQLERYKVRGNLTLLSWLQALSRQLGGPEGWAALVEASGSPASLTGMAHKGALTTKEGAQAILDAHSAELRVFLIDSVLAALSRIGRTS